MAYITRSTFHRPELLVRIAAQPSSVTSLYSEAMFRPNDFVRPESCPVMAFVANNEAINTEPQTRLCRQQVAGAYSRDRYVWL